MTYWDAGSERSISTGCRTSSTRFGHASSTCCESKRPAPSCQPPAASCQRPILTSPVPQLPPPSREALRRGLAKACRPQRTRQAAAGSSPVLMPARWNIATRLPTINRSSLDFTCRSEGRWPASTSIHRNRNTTARGDGRSWTPRTRCSCRSTIGSSSRISTCMPSTGRFMRTGVPTLLRHLVASACSRPASGRPTSSAVRTTFGSKARTFHRRWPPTWN